LLLASFETKRHEVASDPIRHVPDSFQSDWIIPLFLVPPQGPQRTSGMIGALGQANLATKNIRSAAFTMAACF
jgi:hypothetical protein